MREREREREYGSSKLEVEINGTIYISTAARKNEGRRKRRREGTREWPI